MGRCARHHQLRLELRAAGVAVRVSQLVGELSLLERLHTGCPCAPVRRPSGARLDSRRRSGIGESQDYDPSKLVADGAVVVTIDYRLGALGFLAHPALIDGPNESTGAYGLMDQQAALRWVQRNIGQFGGDRRNVTIAGQSAGGLSVLAQVASRRAHGLFARAIVESGAFALTQTPLATAEQSGETFATKAGCSNQNATCLRRLSVSDIELADTPPPTGWTPGVIDGTVLTQSIGTALKSGQFHRVAIINGSTHDESTRFVALDQLLHGITVTTANYPDRIVAALGVSAGTAAVIATRYPLSAFTSPSLALSAVETDAAFACPALTVDQAASRFVPTFAYTSSTMRTLLNVSFRTPDSRTVPRTSTRRNSCSICRLHPSAAH